MRSYHRRRNDHSLVISKLLAQSVPLLEGRPLAPLIGPGEQIGDPAHGSFADWIPPGRRRRQVQQFHLNIGPEVFQSHNLADPLPAKATQPRKVRIVLGFATFRSFGPGAQLPA